MRKQIKSILINSILSIVLLIGFSGCGPVVVSNVSVFHSLPKQVKNKKVFYSFEKYKWQDNNLEYNLYQSKIQDYLKQHNFINNKKSNLIIKFLYGIDKGKEKIGSIPIFGQTGISSSYTTGTINTYGGYGKFSGTTTYTPSYGVVGSSTYSYTNYNRFLILKIFNKNTKKLVYEAKVISKGRSPQLNMVIDEMIEALFKNFPGQNGMSKTIEVPFVK